MLPYPPIPSFAFDLSRGSVPFTLNMREERVMHLISLIKASMLQWQRCHSEARYCY